MQQKSDGELAQYFRERFEVSLALSESQKDAVAQLRYKVYVEEQGFSLPSDRGREFDEADPRSVSILIRNRITGESVACGRLVQTTRIGCILPFAAYAMKFIKPDLFDRSVLLSHHCCEVSRIAIRANYRHRSPQGLPAELRRIPFLALALYYAMGVLVLEGNFDYVFTVSELRLARQKALYGLHFTQISESFNYFGQRALFFTTALRFAREIGQWKPELRALYTEIVSQMEGQVESLDRLRVRII